MLNKMVKCVDTNRLCSTVQLLERLTVFGKKNQDLNCPFLKFIFVWIIIGVRKSILILLSSINQAGSFKCWFKKIPFAAPLETLIFQAYINLF